MHTSGVDAVTQDRKDSAVVFAFLVFAWRGDCLWSAAQAYWMFKQLKHHIASSSDSAVGTHNLPLTQVHSLKSVYLSALDVFRTFSHANDVSTYPTAFHGWVASRLCRFGVSLTTNSGTHPHTAVAHHTRSMAIPPPAKRRGGPS
jgi:hypothetical protein